uniref:SFRICE_003038 n=1 Tax=Spodoptera frugiperda TaxID=7108 RepID=A0A2H1WFW1_SPOFR
MEVADQWRREWAGTAEYGKVTEGGVTRRIARAMEVLHASGPGARVRVMRAAYHSSAAPGAPAASFMLHSSRRVISSGYNLLESPTSPMKPLEISSTPFESSPEPHTEAENYKVTEPDDFEISEPSKWRGSTRGSSIRMPSEESSSTDNASIIDLDSRLGRNLHRKYSYDSENSELQFSSRNTSRNSPLLDTPVTLSTLKYKSLLNSSNDWNSRRKSYSFEDTSPLNETITHSNDILAMESSTDSGICKSTEIVNDQIDDNSHSRYSYRDDRRTPSNEESFKDWLSKNRPTSHYRGTKFKTYREHDIVVEDPSENNITVQSSGKVCINLPITIEADSEEYPKKHQLNEEGDRKVKKVEFCKTEVHFAAESGKVNIIATDEKPPPSNDFRKRRSAFVPMQDMKEKPMITLFGDKHDFPSINGVGAPLNISGSEFGESDENTAATKSILKNKIPKPKPYLLGENMEFGMADDHVNNDASNDSVLSAVSLVNKQLKSDNYFKPEVKPMFPRETDDSILKPTPLRTTKAGPTKEDSLKREKPVVTNIKISKATENSIEDVKSKFNSLHVTPSQRKPKTRQLRDSELTYFGVDNSTKTNSYKNKTQPKSSPGRNDDVLENIFQSVKLIQQVANSVCSEPDSDETPEYQNIPLNMNYAPVPTPRMRTNYEDKPKEEIHEIQVFQPVIEKDSQVIKDVTTRRTRYRRQDEVMTTRSISAPPKSLKRDAVEKSDQREHQSPRTSSRSIKEKKNVEKLNSPNEHNSSDENPIYVNLNVNIEKRNSLDNRDIQKLKTNSLNTRQRRTHKTDTSKNKIESVADVTSDLSKSRIKERRSDSGTDSSLRTKDSGNKDSYSRSTYKDSLSRRAEKSDRIRQAGDNRGKLHEEQNISERVRKSREDKRSKEHKSTMENKEHRSKSLQRPSSKVSEETSRDKSRDVSDAKKSDHRKSSLDRNHHVDSSRKRNSSRDKSTKESIKPSQKDDSSYTVLIPSISSKNNAKDYSTKTNSKSRDSRREYVINYDDKNGTVSSICKITPSLGTPKRKKTTKEIFRDSQNDKPFKNKSVHKIAPRK